LQLQLKGVKALYEESLARARSGAAQQAAQQETQFRAEISRLEAALERHRQLASAAVAAAGTGAGAGAGASTSAGLSGGPAVVAGGGSSLTLEVSGSSAGAGRASGQPWDGTRGDQDAQASSSSQQGTPRHAPADSAQKAEGPQATSKSPVPMGGHMANAQIEELKAKVGSEERFEGGHRPVCAGWRADG
jgi:hypothetical protein